MRIAKYLFVILPVLWLMAPTRSVELNLRFPDLDAFRSVNVGSRFEFYDDDVNFWGTGGTGHRFEQMTLNGKPAVVLFFEWTPMSEAIIVEKVNHEDDDEAIKNDLVYFYDQHRNDHPISFPLYASENLELARAFQTGGMLGNRALFETLTSLIADDPDFAKTFTDLQFFCAYMKPYQESIPLSLWKAIENSNPAVMSQLDANQFISPDQPQYDPHQLKAEVDEAITSPPGLFESLEHILAQNDQQAQLEPIREILDAGLAEVAKVLSRGEISYFETFAQNKKKAQTALLKDLLTSKSNLLFLMVEFGSEPAQVDQNAEVGLAELFARMVDNLVEAQRDTLQVKVISHVTSLIRPTERKMYDEVQAKMKSMQGSHDFLAFVNVFSNYVRVFLTKHLLAVTADQLKGLEPLLLEYARRTQAMTGGIHFLKDASVQLGFFKGVFLYDSAFDLATMRPSSQVKIFDFDDRLLI